MSNVTIREAEEKLFHIEERVHLYKRVISEHFSAREITDEEDKEGEETKVVAVGEGEAPVIIQPVLSIPKLDALMARIEVLRKEETKIRTALEQFKATQTFDY